MSSSLSGGMRQILDRFEEAWNYPTLPRIEDFIPPADSPICTKLAAVNPKAWRVVAL
jgi:hypothetical protein